MKRYRFTGSLVAVFLLVIFALSSNAASKDPNADTKGCSDHPLFTRMQNTHIIYCKNLAFDSFKFKTGEKSDTTVEGRRFEIRYQTNKDMEYAGPLMIIRNHQDAITKIGGTVLHEDKRYTWLKVAKDGKEIWVQVDTAWGRGYMLTIIEKQAMAQQVVASAELFKSGLNTSGHIEVPGIYFDTGKSEVKPESAAAIAEIAKLLKADPALKVYVVGHTDNVASLDLNMRLSKARAEAVVQELVTRHDIAADRLTGQSVGPLSPVVSNDTEEGRAKNRRVELVKQ